MVIRGVVKVRRFMTIAINRRGFLLGWASLLTPAAALARAEAGDLVSLGMVDGAVATAGDRLTLSDGRDARLAGVEAASPPPGAEPGRRWPLAEAAKAALAQATIQGPFELRAESAEPDRYGRLTVHVRRVGDGAWLQELMLLQGHARVRPVPGDAARARAMLAVEDAARRAGRGIWATRVYAVRPAADAGALARDIGALTVAEGRPLRAETRGGKTYLDFGEDWRRDFTAVFSGPVTRALKKEGIDPAALAGRLVRLRGWPEWRFGPQIDIAVPAQLEVID